MNWKYEAIEKLKEYSAKKQSLKSIPEEMARLESAMQSIRSATADGTPVSGGGSGREDMMLSPCVKNLELKKLRFTAAVIQHYDISRYACMGRLKAEK